MFKRIFTSLMLFGIVFSAFWISSFSMVSLDSRIHGPIIRNKNGTSTNWSGYAAYNGTASDVKGSWVVPGVTCGSQNTYSSAWVGIDGYNDGSVEQTGTEQDCINGVASYYAWYEMYPKPGYRIPLNVNVGDVITGEVKYQNGTFVLTLASSNGGNFSTSQKSGKAKRLSAEWIMEAPYSGGVLPLANFGTANYSASNATLSGNSGTISSFTNDQINMVNSNGQLKDQTSSLSPDGSSFSVQWMKSN